MQISLSTCMCMAEVKDYAALPARLVVLLWRGLAGQLRLVERDACESSLQLRKEGHSR